MNRYDRRFLDLSRLTVEEILEFGDFMDVVPCPECIEGWVPDPDGQPVSFEVFPGLVVTEITPIPCDHCGGEGYVAWMSPN